MAGRGPAPKITRRNKSQTPVRGEWQPVTARGWQHGQVPAPPDGIKDISRWAWQTWFEAWFAAHWTPDDLPGLRIVIRMYDEVERGEFTRASELRQLLDNYGITPKGQQDRRWSAPKEESSPSPKRQPASGDLYAHLKAVVD